MLGIPLQGVPHAGHKKPAPPFKKSPKKTFKNLTSLDSIVGLSPNDLLAQGMKAAVICSYCDKIFSNKFQLLTY